MVNFGSKKLEDILKFGIGILLIININILFSTYTIRLDLTEEKVKDEDLPFTELKLE